jgi:hypothetical protein
LIAVRWQSEAATGLSISNNIILPGSTIRACPSPFFYTALTIFPFCRNKLFTHPRHILPNDMTTLSELAINEDGFIFDPATRLDILRALAEDEPDSTIAEFLMQTYAATPNQWHC